jgi:hypothetical protein
MFRNDISHLDLALEGQIHIDARDPNSCLLSIVHALLAATGLVGRLMNLLLGETVPDTFNVSAKD